MLTDPNYQIARNGFGSFWDGLIHKETESVTIPVSESLDGQTIKCSDYITLSFISSVFPDYNNKQFDALSQTGLIERSSETVQIPPLIFYAVWTAENFIPDQEDLKDLCIGLRNFLMCYDDTLSVPYLSSLLLIFAQNLYNNVSITHNPKQNKASGYFETWQDLLSLIFTYYNQNGDFQLAEETHALIHYPDNVQNRHIPLDKDLFHLANNISLYPKSNADDVIKEINKICLSPKINDAFSDCNR